MKMKSLTLLASGLLCATVYACSSSDDTGGGTITHEDGKSTGGATSTGSTGSGNGGLIFGGDTGGTTGAGAGTGAGGALGTGGAICGSDVKKAESLPVDMYIMFDQSSSMGDPLPAPATGTWWSAAQQAVVAFVNNPAATGNGVGIQYFPLQGIAPQSCAADYSTPEVEIAPLPGNAAALSASVNNHSPTSLTPLGVALQNAIKHMKAWGPAHPGRAPIVVLVTDGFATECDPQQPTDIAAMAKEAFTTEPKVRTFLVGFNQGQGKSNLNQVAKAGGTDVGFFIDGGDIGTQFVQAMLSISDAPLSCDFDIPKPDDGTVVNVDKVSVTYTPNATKVTEEVPRLNTLGDCSINNNQGWYYDNAQTPKKILVCPGTCSKFAAGTVETRVGCDPVRGPTM